MYRKRTRLVLATLSALTVASGSLRAQAAPTDTGRPASSEDESVITLDPFTVTTDQEGYKADDTLAGGRVRTSLKDTPASLSVVTKKFMEDLGITNSTDMLVYTASTEVAGLFGNYSGVGNRGTGVDFGGAVENARLVNPAGVNRARGLTAMDQTRNYLPSDIPWDGFNISRVDISRGPNSFLFGTGSPSGISNVSTNEATYKDGGNVEVRYGSFGTTRESLDYNKVLLKNELAFRLDLINGNSKYKQDPAFSDSKRVYAALRYDPSFLKTDSARTKIQASYEHGQVRSNNPRILPPVDYITGYLRDPRASSTGIDPWMFTQNLTEVGADPNYSLWANAGSIGNMYLWGGTPQFYWDGVTGTLLGQGASNYSRGPGSTPNTWPVHSVGFNGYARAANRIALQQGISAANAPYPGAYANTVTYLDQTLSDTGVFDFYNKLIDGDNKREWQDWDAYNLTITQSLFRDRLTIQAVADHQEYSSGMKGVFGNRTPTIMLDLDKYLLTGNPTWLGNPTPNPNVGRPLLFADQGKYEDNKIVRDNYQVTAAYVLDVQRDFNADGLLGRILGSHSFTGLWSKFDRSSENRNFKLDGVDYEYLRVTGYNLNARRRDNGFNWLAYMGPSLLGTTGSSANLENLLHPLNLPSVANFNIYSNEWIADPSVNRTDPWTYTGKDGTTTTTTQADNPANYRGYVQYPFPIISGASNPWVLANSGRKATQSIESKAIMYQGHFWDDTIVPSLGYRSDTTKQSGADANTSGDIVNLDYHITDPGVKMTTNSFSYGVAVHLPKAVKSHLPAGTDVTLNYFHGENETPRVRYGMDGSMLPNESGKTDDVSVQVDALDGRFTVRLTKFKTINANSSAYVGVPLATWLVRGLPAITLQYAGWAFAERQLGFDPVTMAVPGAPASWDTWRTEANPYRWRPHSWMDTNPENAAAFEQAMKTDFVNFFPQSYWDTWGYNVDVEAIKRGDWVHVVRGWDDPWNISKMGGRDTINGEFPTLEQNLESKGYELELTFRPVRNWDITLNGSKVDATQTGFGETATRFIEGMKHVFVDTPVGYGNVWGGFQTAKQMFNGDVWAKYLTTNALVGSAQPEQRKYRFNVISNYRFDHGSLKGLNVGAAYRWEDKAILGYGIYNADITGWIPDVNAPIYGPTEQHVDLWIGYEHKLTKKINWRAQLNLRNAFEKDHLVTIAVQPDGTTAQSRIASGTTYDLSMKFMF